eukprot:scaffold1640_cov111-Isochrysis_galbana.AAC.12
MENAHGRSARTCHRRRKVERALCRLAASLGLKEVGRVLAGGVGEGCKDSPLRARGEVVADQRLWPSLRAPTARPNVASPSVVKCASGLVSLDPGECAAVAVDVAGVSGPLAVASAVAEVLNAPAASPLRAVCLMSALSPQSWSRRTLVVPIPALFAARPFGPSCLRSPAIAASGSIRIHRCCRRKAASLHAHSMRIGGNSTENADEKTSRAAHCSSGSSNGSLVEATSAVAPAREVAGATTDSSRWYVFATTRAK